MLLPILPGWQNGCIIMKEGSFKLDDCDLEDLTLIFDLPEIYYLLEDEIMHFVIAREYSELTFHIDPRDDALIEFHFELLVDLDLKEFFRQFFGKKVQKYHWLCAETDNFIVFSKNFMIRLSKKTNNVACLMFMSTEWIDSCETEFAMQIRQHEAGGDS